MPRRSAYGPGTPCWTDCITTDLAGAQDFYASLFGWEYEDEGPGYRIITLRGGIVGGLGLSPGGRAGSAWNVYLATKDAEVTRVRVLAAGGRVVMGPVPAGGAGRLFLAVDRAGAPVGFWEGHRSEGVVLADEPGTVCGTRLTVPAHTAALDFYGALFGRPPEAAVTESPAAPAHWLPFLGAEDPQATARTAVASGAVLVEAGERPVLKDPWGAAFGLMRAGA
jgi:predicted enzyme related to lactoylglutathione lyase